MLLTAIANTLFVRNGQHLSGDLSRIKLDLKRFWECIEPDIRDYEEFFPVVKQFNVVVNGNGSANTFDFEYHSENPGQDLSNPNNPIGGNAPEWIPSAVPVGNANRISNWLNFTTTGAFPGDLGFISLPRKFLKKYRNKVLYTTEPGLFDVVACYRHWVNITSTPEGYTEVEILNLEDQDQKVLFDILSGRFLMLIGRSRRAFTYQDLPITTDAEHLVEEGKELYDSAMELMYQRHKWVRGIHK